MTSTEGAILSISSGLLGALGGAISFTMVPGLKATSDPLPAWRELYTRGSRIAIPLIFTSTASGIRCYLLTEDKRYLLVCALSVLFIPYTLIFMKPTNKALFAIKDTDKDAGPQKATIRSLVTKWGQLQSVRTFLGLAAFLVNTHINHRPL